MRLAGRTSTRREAALRHRRAAGPRWRSAATALVIAVVCTTVAYVGADSWKKWQAVVPASSDRAAAHDAAPNAATATPPKRSAQGKVTSAAADPDAKTTRVTKCVVNGVTSYSDAECPSNASRSTLTLNPGDNLASGLPAEVRRLVLAAPVARQP